MKKLFTALLAMALLTGCSTLVPKRVEIGQDKVAPFPRPNSSEEEVKRQAAARAAEKAREAEKVAQGTPAETPAHDAAVISEALGRNVGPPKNPFDGTPNDLVKALDKQTAKYDSRLREFAHDNDVNQGKKIEGTGWLSVPYFIWIGGFALIVAAGYAALKLALGLAGAANPGVSLGLNAVGMGGRLLSKAFSQVVRGGQLFKKSLDDELDDPELKQKVLDLFAKAQDHAQDEPVRDAVKKLTKD